MYNVPTYTKLELHRVQRMDHRRKSRTPCNIFANVFVRFPLSVFNSLGVITHQNVHSRNQDFAEEMLEHKVKILCQENVSSWRSAEQTGANQSYVS